MFLIVNADDFGMSKGVNYGIIEAHKNGIVTSTTMMITMPEVNHAIELARKTPTLKMGLHLNMTLGQSLTNCQTLVNNHNMFFKPIENPDYKKFSEEEIYLEFKAQYNMFLEKVGMKPTHFDSHLYAHHIYPQAKRAIMRLALETNLPVRDMTVNGFKDVKFFDFFKGNNGVDLSTILFENIDLFKQQKYSELMVHPAYVDEFLRLKSTYSYPRAQELEILTSDEIKQALKENNIELIGYDDERIRIWQK
ncbi:MAG: chitin disaccharide deacetylase [Acholeplasmataceae bacterium]|jgi:predicted glycoside hydrolase/deacetylase ChbG (UPF0249 family)